MYIQNAFCIRFSDITLRFTLPAPVILPEELAHFICEDDGSADAKYEIRLLQKPLSPEGPPIESGDTTIYRTEEGWLRVYLMRIADDGCQVACLLRSDGNNILYYPVAMWDFYSSPLHCLPQLGIEHVLLSCDAFLLHSSVVEINGKAVLFCGPSGAGKSTQASNWSEYRNATILNGDRCVIQKRPDGFYGGGSPWCGSSKIYSSEAYPIAGIFLLDKAGNNRVNRMGAKAFSRIFSQTLVNSWDLEFMQHITGLVAELFQQIPIFHLECRPDKEAVDLAYQTIF